MRRAELLHVARAAAEVAGVRRVLIVGSQAVLGSFHEEDLPAAAVASLEADVVILDDASGDAAHRVEGALGFMSMFHQEYTYYADGMSLEETALPDGWEGRCLELVTEDAQGEVSVYCPEIHDLCVSKLAANRPHDRRFVQALADHGLVHGAELVERAAALSSLAPERRQAVSSTASTLAAGRSIIDRI